MEGINIKPSDCLSLKQKAFSLILLILVIFIAYSIHAIALDAVSSKDPNSTKAFDPANMNLSARQGDDFYEYVNGIWIKNHPVPPDKPSYGEVRVVRDKTDERVRELVEGGGEQHYR